MARLTPEQRLYILSLDAESFPAQPYTKASFLTGFELGLAFAELHPEEAWELLHYMMNFNPQGGSVVTPLAEGLYEGPPGGF